MRCLFYVHLSRPVRRVKSRINRFLRVSFQSDDSVTLFGLQSVAAYKTVLVVCAPVIGDKATILDFAGVPGHNRRQESKP